ncbi:MAG: sulfite exporter TauE/SafE family protein [Actinobacteria bacterium]|nr:sulfite exporter TauE/SafE family protein [Actinomycetota bacterium]
MSEPAVIAICFFFIAMLYSAVGHAGASAYLATMALLEFSPDEMKPAALALNVLVAAITSIRFYRAGYFSWRLLWPFAAASIPLAYIGGGLTVSADSYRLLVGAALIFAAIHLLARYRASHDDIPGVRTPGLPASMTAGGIIGLASGLTGVGGGIFLSPVLLLRRWAGLRQTSAAAAVFILANSAAGLAGHLQNGGSFPSNMPVWALAVIAGGFLGSWLGATRFNNRALRMLLGLVLVLAGLRMVA